MTLQTPRGARLVGRSRQQRDEDVRRLTELVELLPVLPVEGVIRDMLRDQLREDFGAALAAPLMMNEGYRILSAGAYSRAMALPMQMTRLSYAGDGDEAVDVVPAPFQGVPVYSDQGILGPFAAALQREAATQEPSVEFVRREAQTARQAIVRDWVNAVRDAWRMWGLHAGVLQLTGARLEAVGPVESPGVYTEWKEMCEQGRASLLASIAVDADGMDRILTAFGQALWKTCRRAPVALPGGLVIARHASKELLVRAEATAMAAGGRAEAT